MRPLVIGPQEKEKIAAVVAYAMDHIYKPGDPTPGDNANFVTIVPMGFRCVFTFTRKDDKLWRHLSVSTPNNPGRMPSPEGMVMLAGEFGFTGADPGLSFEKCLTDAGWVFAVDKEHNCIVLFQEAISA